MQRHIWTSKGVTAAPHLSLVPRTGLQCGNTRSYRIGAGNVPSIGRRCAGWRICMRPAGVCGKVGLAPPAAVITCSGTSVSACAPPFSAALSKCGRSFLAPCDASSPAAPVGNYEPDDEGDVSITALQSIGRIVHDSWRQSFPHKGNDAPSKLRRSAECMSEVSMAMVVTSSLPQFCPSQLALSTAMVVLLQHVGVGLIPVAAVLWVLADAAKRERHDLMFNNYKQLAWDITLIHGVAALILPGLFSIAVDIAMQPPASAVYGKPMEQIVLLSVGACAAAWSNLRVLDIRSQLIGGCPRLLRSALAAASIGHLLVALRACTVGARLPLMRFANQVAHTGLAALVVAVAMKRVEFGDKHQNAAIFGSDYWALRGYIK